MAQQTITFAEQWHGQVWRPESGANAVVCMVHGLGEHIGRYDHWAARFNQAGYVFLGADLPGHGHSPGRRGHFPGYPTIYTLIDAMLDYAEQSLPGAPIFLYGHSMGGNMVLNFILDRSRNLAGVMVSAPLIIPAVKVPAWKELAARALLKVWPTLSMANEIDTALIARDTQAVNAYETDALVHNLTTPRILDVVRAGERLPSRAGALKHRLLLIHGESDGITDPAGSKAFAAAAGERCTLKILPQLYHEVHNEPEKDQVFRLILNWMQAGKTS